MGHTTDVPVWRWRARVHNRRPARLRRDAAGRWAPARRLTIAVASIGGGDDHRSPRRRPRVTRALARRLARMGLRRGGPGPPPGPGTYRRKLRMGRRPRLVL